MNGGEAINIILGRRDRYPGPLFRFDEPVPYDSWLRFYYLLWPQYGNGWIWHGNGLRVFSSRLDERIKFATYLKNWISGTTQR